MIFDTVIRRYFFQTSQRSTKNQAATIRLPIQTVFTEQLISCADLGFDANKYDERTIFCVVRG